MILIFLTPFLALSVSSCSEPAPSQQEVTGKINAAANTASTDIKLTGRVVDEADILTDPFMATLSDKLALLEQESGPQMVVVTVADLGNKEIEEVSLELASNWGIGDAERHDGVLIMVAPNDRKVRIEVGAGLETVLTNQYCAEVIQEHMLPAFRNGDFEKGIEDGTQALIQKLRTALALSKSAPAPAPASNDNNLDQEKAA